MDNPENTDKVGKICPVHNKPMFEDIDPYRAEIHDENVLVIACEDCFQEMRYDI